MRRFAIAVLVILAPTGMLVGSSYLLTEYDFISGDQLAYLALAASVCAAFLTILFIKERVRTVRDQSNSAEFDG